MWPTPRAASKTGGAGARGNLSAEEIKQVCRAHLNPAWVEWLMGWPINWTALELIGNAGEWQAKTNSGEWWQTDPADLSGEGQIPRTAGKLKNRVQRLQAIGNGQVPAVVKMAWEILTNTP